MKILLIYIRQTYFSGMIILLVHTLREHKPFDILCNFKIFVLQILYVRLIWLKDIIFYWNLFIYYRIVWLRFYWFYMKSGFHDSFEKKHQILLIIICWLHFNLLWCKHFYATKIYQINTYRYIKKMQTILFKLIKVQLNK